MAGGTVARWPAVTLSHRSQLVRSSESLRIRSISVNFVRQILTSEATFTASFDHSEMHRPFLKSPAIFTAI